MSNLINLHQDVDNLNRTLEALEIKIAYQDDTIESLNQTIIQQQDKIQNIEYVLNKLIEKMKSMSSNDVAIQQEVELPPHY